MDQDVVYYRQRAREERDAARRSLNPNVSLCHARMAEAYELKVRAIIAENARRAFRLVDAA
jgi:hypothetical protein